MSDKALNRYVFRLCGSEGIENKHTDDRSRILGLSGTVPGTTDVRIPVAEVLDRSDEDGGRQNMYLD